MRDCQRARTSDQTTNKSRNILRKLGFLVFNMAVGQEVHIEISQEISMSLNKTDKVPELQMKQQIYPEIFKETRILSVQYGRGPRSSHRD